MRLNEKPETVQTSGCWVEIEVPVLVDGVVKYVSRKISPQNLGAGSSQNAPLLLTDKTDSQPIGIDANTWVEKISFKTVSGNPTIRIGTSPNGTDIIKDILVNSSLPVIIQNHYLVQTSIYITISGGNVNIRVDFIKNYN